MAYVQPMVMVFQEYASTSTSTGTCDLVPCIIGPCYHIMDSTASSSKSFAGTYYNSIQNAGTTKEIPAGFTDKVFPNNKPGASVVEDSVKFHLKDARVQLRHSMSIDTTKSKDNKLVFQLGNFPTGFQVGDIIPLVSKGQEVEYVVTEVKNAYRTLALNRTLPSTLPSQVEVQRIISDVEVTKDTTGVTVDTQNGTFSMYGVQVAKVSTYDDNGNLTASFANCPVMTAQLYVDYTALRTDLTYVGTIDSVSEIEGTLGSITPDNPLAFGVNVALSNTTTSVRFIGIPSDDLAGYTDAKDRLEAYDPVYALVPLTQDTGVLSMFKNHAVAMSEAEESRWRIVIGNCKMPENVVKASGKGKVGYDGSNRIVFTGTSTPEESDKIAFLTDDVQSGDKLMVTVGTSEYEYVIDEVVAEDQVTVMLDNPFDDSFVANYEYSFEIIHEYNDRTEVANAIAAISKSFGSMRFVNVWPDLCTIGEYENLPGYYLACAVAGGVGGLKPHYPFTNLSMSGITSITHSNDYFNKTQLNLIADGGTFIFVQSSPESVPYVRHQLTTDRSAIEYQELSFVKTFDYVSYMCRDTLAPYIGTWNITGSLLSAIENALNSVLDSIRLSTSPKIGSAILSYSITSVAQSENSKDRVEVYVNVTFPYPLNTIGLHIISQ